MIRKQGNIGSEYFLKNQLISYLLYNEWDCAIRVAFHINVRYCLIFFLAKFYSLFIYSNLTNPAHLRSGLKCVFDSKEYFSYIFVFAFFEDWESCYI